MHPTQAISLTFYFKSMSNYDEVYKVLWIIHFMLLCVIFFKEKRPCFKCSMVEDKIAECLLVLFGLYCSLFMSYFVYKQIEVIQYWRKGNISYTMTEVGHLWMNQLQQEWINKLMNVPSLFGHFFLLDIFKYSI